MSRQLLRALAVLAVFAPRVIAGEALPEGRHARVPITAAARLDWVFALANQSPAKPPAEWLKGYDSTTQGYQLVVPRGLAKPPEKIRPLPLLLFISPGERPFGYAQWQAVCQKHGVLFACPHAAGNRCPFPRRVKIVIDTLDDIRRRFPIDPDRTYLAGFSGGGRVACAIAFALPEYFGGVASICAAGDLRTESWLRRRVADRLSVALVTGETDFNRSEIERFRGPLLKEVGVRARSWTQKGAGHAISAGPLAEVFAWLEQDLPRRAALARAWPASRITSGAAPGRDAWAKALLEEGKKRLASPATVYSGLMQLKGVRVRWSDLPEAAEASRVLREYEGRRERPWEKEDIAEQRKFLVARARGLDAYGTGPLPPQYERQRTDMLKAALALWDRVLKDGQDKPALEQARRRIPVLTKRLAGERENEP